ncbi:MAG TPA: hypothetical protein ENK43_07535 [Planctomycetes bacterium]|nr:hypothetical protein [Planctomycetota bacterium]
MGTPRATPLSLHRIVDLVAELHRRVHVVRSLHALPFALTGVLWASGGLPSTGTLALVVFIVIFGRGLATSLLRFFRAPADVANPESPAEARTSQAVPRPVWAAFAFHAAAFLIFLSYQLNELSGHLSWFVCVGLVVHAAIRRFTGLTHFLVGLGLAGAPIGGWVATRGALTGDAWPIALFGAATLFWAAGLDMVYSLLAPVDAPEHGFQRPPWLTPSWVIRLAQAAQITSLLLFGMALGSYLAKPVAVATTATVAILLVASRISLGSEHAPTIRRRFFWLQFGVGPALLAGTVIHLALL